MNSILKKQLFIQFIMLILIFVLLLTTLTFAFSKFFHKEREEILINYATEISNTYKQSLFLHTNINNELKNIEKYIDASFIVTDYNDKIKVISSDIENYWLGKFFKISDYKLKKNNSFVKLKGKIPPLFNQKMVVIGYPMFFLDNYIGAVFICYPAQNLLKTIEQSYKIILPIMFGYILLAFALTYIFSKKLTSPLIQISNNAKLMASGNFEKKINIKSNDEIGQLADALNEMSENIFKQEKKRDEFISNLAHDIRSPLTSIKGFIEALLDGTIPPEKTTRYLKILLEETNRLTKLSNNVLDISRLKDNNQNNKIAFDINELIRNTTSCFETRLLEKNLKINASFEKEKIIVFADIEKIERVIYNLIDNAIKFTENYKNIYISTKIKSNKALITVKDEGVGIPIDMQKKVFERFFKSDFSRGKDKMGSGLGLYIVKNFILSQGENITLKSQEGQGCEFLFTLSLFE